MSKEVMSRVDIKKLCRILRDLFLHHKELKEKEPLARKIKNPQIPQDLSESLAYHLVKSDGLIPELEGWSLARSVNNRDLVATKKGKENIAEVKATAGRGWQRLSAKDVSADFLVWLDFNTFFEAVSQDVIMVYVIPRPGRFFKAREDVFVSDLRGKISGDLRQHKILLRL